MLLLLLLLLMLMVLGVMMVKAVVLIILLIVVAPIMFVLIIRISSLRLVTVSIVIMTSLRMTRHGCNERVFYQVRGDQLRGFLPGQKMAG